MEISQIHEVIESRFPIIYAVPNIRKDLAWDPASWNALEKAAMDFQPLKIAALIAKHHCRGNLWENNKVRVDDQVVPVGVMEASRLQHPCLGEKGQGTANREWVSISVRKSKRVRGSERLGERERERGRDGKCRHTKHCDRHPSRC